MPRKAPAKCYKCAALHIDQVHQLHGSPKTDPENFLRDPNIPSDGCYNLKLCPPKRSRLRNTEINSQKQAIEQQEQQFERLNIESPYLDLVYAVLIVYREAGYDSPVHAIAGSVWKGNEQIVEITPVHCEAMTPSIMEAYTANMLSVLYKEYGIRKFAAQVRRDPQCCPIRPCYLEAVR
ncbi:hypothetical protein NIES2135_60480 (plasmid) [Leptolyngbya boryana NIES-2135]|jgi:hypothetical protein|uniref:Uncharacterized protein n=1 Tax=Leptolyngbya boryana NIES-2135 TaxID=1973484 RepID=A0A1Z4JQX9_LEPBY|nr:MULTISPECIES: hypothetical protein [Leptolyngbya]BAY59171.1 hypothetical protein NIES2135_60480 [Leptolyngbya boryana NIES-2135]MBD2372757.1 hypothetical protein [Leptolyngbya sp. FACHB-238]MBD2397491.1 hypothetical protein [Leptolyngbya sp. FACHB-239]MBD2403704.1 hypothetical protein [Leptolyngbya sp. FACHB-402]ULP33364.1 hypothetical protein MCP04_29985 [Leptolyngbya boryana IU 594]